MNTKKIAARVLAAALAVTLPVTGAWAELPSDWGTYFDHGQARAAGGVRLAAFRIPVPEAPKIGVEEAPVERPGKGSAAPRTAPGAAESAILGGQVRVDDFKATPAPETAKQLAAAAPEDVSRFTRTLDKIADTQAMRTAYENWVRGKSLGMGSRVGRTMQETIYLAAGLGLLGMLAGVEWTIGNTMWFERLADRYGDLPVELTGVIGTLALQATLGMKAIQSAFNHLSVKAQAGLARTLATIAAANAALAGMILGLQLTHQADIFGTFAIPGVLAGFSVLAVLVGGEAFIMVKDAFNKLANSPTLRPGEQLELKNMEKQLDDLHAQKEELLKKAPDLRKLDPALQGSFKKLLQPDPESYGVKPARKTGKTNKPSRTKKKTAPAAAPQGE